MTMIDYGAILKKNGKIVNRNQFFMDMETTVGWTDYPHAKHGNCDCLGEDGRSDCSRANCIIHKFEGGIEEWKNFVSNCCGLKPNFNHIEGNWFAYVGDTEFVVGFYEQRVMTWFKGEQKVYWLRWDYAGQYSIYIEVGGTKLHFKALSEKKDVYYGRFYYKGDLYEVVFGYGIDSTQSTWNRVKKDYCDKKTIKFVDKFWEEK